MILAKWGGSLLSNKSGRAAPRFRGEVAARLSRELAAAMRTTGEPAVLVHGAGSFGHPAALRHRVGIVALRGPKLTAVVGEIRGQVETLQQALIGALIAAGLPAVAAPAHLLARSQAGRAKFDPSLLESSLAAGFLVVTGGDVILDSRLGARVISGDELLYLIAKWRRPSRVVFASDVDALRVGSTNAVEVPPRALGRILETMEPGTDATGGMRGKLAWIQRLQKLGLEAWLVNGRRPGRFEAAAAGQAMVGTRFPARAV